MKSTVKQHYVPRFYLKNFCLPNSELLFCFDKVTGKSFQTNIKDIAHENLFYGLNFGDGSEDAIEKSLARVESRFFVSPYKQLLTKRNYKKLSHDEKAWFCASLGLQVMRSNDTRLRIKEMREKVVMEIAKDELQREEGIRIPDWVTMKYTDPEYVKALHIDSMITDGVEPFFELGKHFFNKTWVVLRNENDLPLWTSDNPISFHNNYGGEGNLGILSPGVEIRYPLSSNLLLYSYDPKLDPPHTNNEKMSKEKVAIGNLTQIVSSTRFIYSRFNDFELARNYLEKYPRYKKPSRSRFKVILNNDIIETMATS